MVDSTEYLKGVAKGRQEAAAEVLAIGFAWSEIAKTGVGPNGEAVDKSIAATIATVMDASADIIIRKERTLGPT